MQNTRYRRLSSGSTLPAVVNALEIVVHPLDFIRFSKYSSVKTAGIFTTIANMTNRLIETFFRLAN